MEQESGMLLHIETFDKREVAYKSPNLECEGLKQCLSFLKSKNKEYYSTRNTTDASRTIISFLGITCTCNYTCTIALQSSSLNMNFRTKKSIAYIAPLSYFKGLQCITS